MTGRVKATLAAVLGTLGLLTLASAPAAASEADQYVQSCSSSSGVQICSWQPLLSVTLFPTPIAGTSQFGVTLGSVKGLPSIPATANAARVCVRTAEVETTEDGSTPTTVPRGTAFAVGTCTWIYGRNAMLPFLMVSSSGTVDVEYFQ